MLKERLKQNKDENIYRFAKDGNFWREREREREKKERERGEKILLKLRNSVRDPNIMHQRGQDTYGLPSV